MGDAHTEQFTREEIEQLKKGNHTAFTKLFKQFFHHIRFFCERIVKDKFEAEDIAVLTFTKYLERAEKFDDLGQIQAFLYIAARNACFDYIDKQKAKQNYTLQAASSEAFTYEVTRFEYEAIMFEKLLTEVIKEIEKLPEQSRRVVEMVVFKKMSYEEVARQLNITEGTVRMHRSNAIKKLKMIFSEKELLLVFSLFFGYCNN